MSTDWVTREGLSSSQLRVRYGYAGERRCPARTRDNTRCTNEAGAWTYAGLCSYHAELVRRRCRVVLVDGMRLEAPWQPGRPYRGHYPQKGCDADPRTDEERERDAFSEGRSAYDPDNDAMPWRAW